MHELATSPPSPAADAEVATPQKPAAAAAPAQLARVVYMVASHVNPPQVMRLVRACLSGSPRSRVLVHHDYNVSHLDPDAVRALDPDRVDLIRARVKLKWGGPAQHLPVTHSLEWLLRNRDFDWAVALSGTDYPCQPLLTTERFLTDTPYDGFLDVGPVERAAWLLGAQRYHYQFYELPKFPGHRHVRNLIRSRAERARAAGREPRLIVPQDRDPRLRVGYRPRTSLFNDRFRCWFGSCWWTLNRRAVVHLMRTLADRPEIERWYRRTLFALNESIFATVLMNNPDLRIVTDDEKRYITWRVHQEGGHPDTLTTNDFPRMIATGDHFARKFDAGVDERVLDLLDEHLGVRR